MKYKPVITNPLLDDILFMELVFRFGEPVGTKELEEVLDIPESQLLDRLDVMIAETTLVRTGLTYAINMENIKIKNLYSFFDFMCAALIIA